MKFEDNNYFAIDKNEFENVLKEDRENVYLYHFIFVKYLEDNKVEFKKIDNVNDLKLLENKKILVKYYVEKIHYFNDCRNDEFEYGEPYFIFNVGYFYIGGLIRNKKDETEKIKALFEKYENDYSTIHFPFDDVKYLSLNK